MHADRRSEAGEPGQRQGLPQAAGRPAEQHAGRDDAAAAEEATAESSPIVGDERDETGVGGVELGNRQAHELQVLRHEHPGHAHREDRRAGKQHTEAGDQQSQLPEPAASVEATEHGQRIPHPAVPDESA